MASVTLSPPRSAVPAASFPSSCSSRCRSKRYFRRRFGTSRRNAKGDNKAIASDIKRPWIIIYVSREEKKRRGLRVKKEKGNPVKLGRESSPPLPPPPPVFPILGGNRGGRRLPIDRFEFSRSDVPLVSSRPADFVLASCGLPMNGARGIAEV